MASIGHITVSVLDGMAIRRFVQTIAELADAEPVVMSSDLHLALETLAREVSSVPDEMEP